MRRARPIPMPLVLGAAALSLAAVLLGAAAAMPIYRTPWVWAVAGGGWALAFAAVWLGRRLRWGAATLGLLVVVFVLAVVPLAVPASLGSDAPALVSALGDGLAAVALGWKQLLTLALPLGTYQAVLVPLLVVTMGSTAAVAALAFGSARMQPFAALPALAPVAFGTVFGSSEVSADLGFAPFVIAAPRELGLWLAAAGCGAIWVAWASGIGRRRALRLGRRDLVPGAGAAPRRSSMIRAVCALLIVAVGLGAGAAVAPLIETHRTVPRDRVDPELVIREQTSPLAGYRAAKRDDGFSAPMFTVEADGTAPARLRMAVLDGYDGVDFFVSPGQSGRFTRFPSGEPIDDAVDVRVTFAAGYDGIWLPVAPPLAAPPRFTGDRSHELSDAFYVNRETWGAIAVADGGGVRAGDGFEAAMHRAGDPPLPAAPAEDRPLIDLERMPELERWLVSQRLPATGDGLAEAIERLRARGYLSHSLTSGEGEGDWFEAVSKRYGTQFVASAGGHSIARVEALFEQLNEQQSVAGDGAADAALVAGIGDDEQFAAAAALLARAMGFESRVVVGVRLGETDATDAHERPEAAEPQAPEGGVPGVPACTGTCTGEHLAAWIEVRGAEGTWAPIDASPQVEIPPSMLERGEQLPEFPTIPEERDASETDPPVGTSGDVDDARDEPERAELGPLWVALRAVGLSLLALLLLALPLCCIPAAKRLRSALHRGGPPEARAVGAWNELLDGYADSGLVPHEKTRRDIAEALGAPEATRIASLVDGAVYAREGITEADAATVRALVDSALAARRTEIGAWGRMRARYSLRSLLPRRARRRKDTGER